MGGKGRRGGGDQGNRIRQREKLTCDAVSTENSGEPAGSFEAGKTIQSCLMLGQGDWDFRPPCWLVYVCREPPAERLSLAEAILKGSWQLRASACWQHSQQMMSQSFIPEGVSGQRAGVSSADLHSCICPFALSSLSTLASSPLLTLSADLSVP